MTASRLSCGSTTAAWAGGASPTDDTEVLLDPDQPVVDVVTVDTGHASPTERLTGSQIGSRLRYVGHRGIPDERTVTVRIDLDDPDSGLAVSLDISSPVGVAALTACVRLRNGGEHPILLQSVTSVVLPLGRADQPMDLRGLVLLSGANQWLGESRWRYQPLRAVLPELEDGEHGADPKQAVVARSVGSWSTGGDLPLGALTQPAGRFGVVWQVEHNGAWRWEVGERRFGPALAASGPTDLDHAWLQLLAPDEGFETVPATVAVAASVEAAVAELTAYRRRVRRPHHDHEALHLVFNDYMNTLMGDPTTAKLLPLIDSAADAGAEVFCVDAGWYDDGGDWWPSVGAWQPSQTRFPGGLGEVTDRIRAAGMVAGLWLEPEVVGVRSPVAENLPQDAFFLRHGQRVTEAQRFHLDLSHPAAREHVDEMVDRLVETFGVGYFKLDYNINPGPGTDAGGVAPGVGLLRHNRAQLDWLDGVLDRHPELIIENCSSGAMRMDSALLSRLQLQSTSDQQDYLRYPVAAATAPMSMLPEQAGNWAYPHAEMDVEQTAFALANGVLGRLYLSGYLDRLSSDQLTLVREAVSVHKSIRADIARSVPSWPLGLPGWDDPTVALALHAPTRSLVTVWQRGPGQDEVILALPSLRGRRLRADVIFPTGLPAWGLSWAAERGQLVVNQPASVPSARVLALTEEDA